MKLSEAVYDVISGAPAAVTPQHVRDEIKRRYPDLYGFCRGKKIRTERDDIDRMTYVARM